MYQPVLRRFIWAEERGPLLRLAHYVRSRLRALEYSNPDGEVGHLFFNGTQVSMFTTRDVYNCGRDEINWGAAIDQAAVVKLGKSEWLLSFAQERLDHCSHHRIMLCDEFLDAICENVTAGRPKHLMLRR
jgi:hypothetical protein